MPLADDVERYLKSEDDGRRLYGNAIGGARDGLYVFNDAEALLQAAIRNALPDETDDPIENIRVFIQSFMSMRFVEEPKKRCIVRDDYLPMPSFGMPNLVAETVYSVTTLKALRRAMSEDDIKTLAGKSVIIKADGTVDDEATFRSALALLKPTETSFALRTSEGLGRFLLWFTTEPCLREAEARCSNPSDPISMVESVRSRNGLGHRKSGEWLVLLKIPGAFIERAGHYRPIFCDGGVGPDHWFMSRSSDHASFTGGPWGQTCDLEALQAGGTTYDGAHERVAIQPWHEDLGSDRIGFEVLGPVEDRFGTLDAMKRLTDGIWTRKDL